MTINATTIKAKRLLRGQGTQRQTAGEQEHRTILCHITVYAAARQDLQVQTFETSDAKNTGSYTATTENGKSPRWRVGCVGCVRRFSSPLSVSLSFIEMFVLRFGNDKYRYRYR